MSVQAHVQTVINKINEKAERNTEQTVENLVNKIISTKADIAQSQKNLVEYTKQLKELEMPTPVTLDLE